MSTITSANVAVVLSVPGVFPLDQLLDGYATDDAFAHDSYQTSETRMGVDGKLSGGFTPAAKNFKITFQPDSDSIGVFDLWGTSQEIAKELFVAGMTISMPSIGKAFIFTKGFLQDFKKLPDAKKVLEPQTYSIIWEDIQPVPL